MSPLLEARIRPLLKGNAFLERLPDTVLDTMMQRGQSKKYAKGELVFRRGDAGDRMMLLVTGGIKLTIISARAKEVVLRFAGVGEVFGVIAALDGKPRATSATALEESEVFIVHSRDLLPALTACPQAMTEVVRSLCERARTCTSLFEDQTLDMRIRIARGLLRLAKQLGRRCKDGIRLELAASQEELGNHLGLARANVSRQLGDLKALNIIKTDGARIVITDERRLAELAEAGSVE
jgi:CRP/FNR family transcriptional regulator, cyclic AMP receptor protein